MFFIFIQAIITLCVALAAAGFSVYGLAYTFAGMFAPVVFMGCALEAGKLLTASFLYRYWNKINWWLKLYLSLAVIVLIIITSIGIFSFLSKGYQEDTLVLNNNKIKIEQLESEKKSLIEQKKEINKYRAEATKAVVSAEKSTRRWMFTEKNATAKQARADISIIDNRMTEIGKELVTLQQAQINTQLHVGPIIYLAKAIHKDVDVATTYLIVLLILVFDPLAVALTISLNISLKVYNDEKVQNELNSYEKSNIMKANLMGTEHEKEHEKAPIAEVVEDIDELLDDIEHHEPLTEEQIEQNKWLEDILKRKQLIDDIRYNI